MSKKRLTPKQKVFLAVYELSPYNITNACKKANISRTTFYDWVNKSDVFAKKVKDAEEAVVDYGISAFIKKIREGDTQCILHLMKTKGRDRDFKERQEVEHFGDLPVNEIKINVVKPD